MIQPPKKQKTLSETLDAIQREKLNARPPELDPHAVVALMKQKIMDFVDDKYMALHDEIAFVRRDMMRLSRPTLWQWVRYRLRRRTRAEEES